MKSLFKTVFIIIIFSVITRIIGFLFRIYISRTIGAEALGEYQVSFSVFMVLLTIISSGLPFIVSKLTAKYVAEKNPLQERKMVTASVVIGLILSLILCGIVLIFLPVLRVVLADEKCITILLILLPALVFSSIYSTLRGNIWGRNKYLSLCLTELFEQVARVLIFVILIQGSLVIHDGAYVSAISLTIACLLSAVAVLTIYFATGGKFKFEKNKQLYKQLIKTSAPITGVRIAGSLIQPLVALIVPMRLISAGYTSSQALSLYGTAIGMTLPFLFIPSTITGSLSTALVPDLSSAMAKNDTAYIKARVVSAIKFTIYISALFIPIYMGAGTFIGEFFYANTQSGMMLEQAAWVILPMGITNITSSLLNSLGYEIKSMKNYILGAIVMILSIWFLPKFIGIQSLIWGFGICFIITSFLNIKMLKQILNCNLNLKKYLILIIIFILPSASICSLITNLLSNFLPSFFSIAIGCVFSVCFFVLLSMVFNLIEFNMIKSKIKTKLPQNLFKKKKKLKI